MKKLIFISAFLIAITCQAQDNIVKGHLFDFTTNNEPITFGKVTIKETKESVSTDFRGNYYFKNLPEGTYTLEFSFLGYTTETKKITINENQTLELDAFIKQSQGVNFDDIVTASILN